MTSNFKQYILGFLLSIGLTVLAFLIVINHWLSDWDLILVIMTLALIQLWVQLIFFLHLDREVKPHWNFTVFLSTVSVILVIIIGTLWIMNNLNYHTPTDEEIIKSEGF